MNTTTTRKEIDLLGELDIPSDAYYGIQTYRAIKNFSISHTTINNYPEFIIALAQVKKAAAQTNHQLGLLNDELCNAIVWACDKIIQGEYHAAFPIDVFQGGAGTSTNMNANEVIANIALEYLGKAKGDSKIVSPNDHVNLSQSTNDAYPTALKLAVYAMHQHLSVAIGDLSAALAKKADEFDDVIKMGRTQLQDAVPMTLGQEFDGFAYLVQNSLDKLHRASEDLLEVNMGATAIGTGINAPNGFDKVCAAYLAKAYNANIFPTANLIATTSDTSCFVNYSSALKAFALRLIKICNDLRLLSSGPRTGIYEIKLPERQPGSSIMPGKVNPVIPEVVNQICYKVIGNDLTITLAAENAQLQLNVMEPVIAQSLFESIALLENGIKTFIMLCINGIEANRKRAIDLVHNSVGIVTALNPVIGYKMSTEIAKQALHEHKSVKEVVLERGLLSEEELNTLLNPKNMI
jgi:aspartate ammonia-lyase